MSNYMQSNYMPWAAIHERSMEKAREALESTKDIGSEDFLYVEASIQSAQLAYELLEALEAAEKELHYSEDFKLDPLAGKIRAAIAKAKGEA